MALNDRSIDLWCDSQGCLFLNLRCVSLDGSIFTRIMMDTGGGGGDEDGTFANSITFVSKRCRGYTDRRSQVNTSERHEETSAGGLFLVLLGLFFPSLDDIPVVDARGGYLQGLYCVSILPPSLSFSHRAETWK